MEHFSKMCNKMQKFVQMVEHDPCLYNNTLAEYSRKDLTEKGWSAIAKEMQWTVTDCKEKWKNLRNGFVRTVKASPSGSSSKAKKPYYLHDNMQFLLPFIKPVRPSEQTGNSSLSEDESESQSKPSAIMKYTEESENKSEPSKRKRNPKSLSKMANTKKLKEHREEEGEADDNEDVSNDIHKKPHTKSNDYREMFLLSLLPDVEKLSERNLRQFKIKTLLLLEQQLTEQEQVAEQCVEESQTVNYSTNSEFSATALRRRRSTESCVKNRTPSPVDVKPDVTPSFL